MPQGIFTVTKLEEQGNVPELKVASGMVEMEFREINRRTEIEPRWSDQCVDRAARLLKEVRLDGSRLEFLRQTY